MKELCGEIQKTPKKKLKLQVEKEQRKPPYSIASSSCSSLSAHNSLSIEEERLQQESLRYLAKIIVKSYMQQNGL